MRHLTLNLLSAGLATLLLGAITVFALDGAATPVKARDAAAATAPRPLTAHPFGVYVDPWHVDEWARSVGAEPQLLAKFEAFSNNRTIDGFLGEAQRRGFRRLMVSWEPWHPVPTALGALAQFQPQPGYRNGDIARGVQDAYIARFAASLARFPGQVDLRWAHEMNGRWYPWSHGPASYRAAWRRIVGLFDRAGARNVRFVWSVNPNLYQRRAAWRRVTRRYWPGSRYVDAVGMTMIDFGGEKDYRVARFAPRLADLRRTYCEPIVLTEVNTAYHGRVRWLRAFRRLLERMPGISAVYWSQLPSRGTAHLDDAGLLDWDVQRDPPAAAQLRQIVRAGRR
jgi:hypothetical protein